MCVDVCLQNDNKQKREVRSPVTLAALCLQDDILLIIYFTKNKELLMQKAIDYAEDNYYCLGMFTQRLQITKRRSVDSHALCFVEQNDARVVCAEVY